VLHIAELLRLRGMNTDLNIKIVRHQDTRYDVRDLQRDGIFELYQSYQGRPVFDGCSQIVSFIGLPNRKALLFGVYSVGKVGKRKAGEVPLPADFPHSKYPNFISPNDWYYQLNRERGFGDLEGRVVIDWGRSLRVFVQWLCRQGEGVVENGNKEVVEILPAGYVTDFPGYLDVVLEYEQLVAIIKNADASRNWHTLLSAVAGVYLITDTVTGLQYVGSAYGKSGILGRWSEYAKDPTGGNAPLIKLLGGDKRYAKHLQFSILETLDKTLTRTEVILREWRYKKKLGPKAVPLDPKPKDNVDTCVSLP